MAQSQTAPGRNGVIMFMHGASPAGFHTVRLKSGAEKTVRKTRSGDKTPAYSPDGAKVAFERNSQIWVMDANGKHKTRLTSQKGYPSEPCWSPDGSKIAYSSTEDDSGNVDIYVMKANGHHHVRLTSAQGPDFQCTWSVHNQIAFTSERVGNSLQLFVMNADGSHQKDVSNDTSVFDSDPDWSPDGSTIVFSSVGRDHPGSVGPDLWTMSASGADITPVNHQASYSDGYQPTWSPNGRLIAFSANNGTGDLKIWVIAADGSGQQMVAGSQGQQDYDEDPTWQPR